MGRFQRCQRSGSAGQLPQVTQLSPGHLCNINACSTFTSLQTKYERRIVQSCELSITYLDEVRQIQAMFLCCDAVLQLSPVP